jgi:hypothetical protein
VLFDEALFFHGVFFLCGPTNFIFFGNLGRIILGRGKPNTIKLRCYLAVFKRISFFCFSRRKIKTTFDFAADKRRKFSNARQIFAEGKNLAGKKKLTITGFRFEFNTIFYNEASTPLSLTPQ